MTYIPTPVFIPRMSSTPRCPSCKNEENKVEVCKNCGYIYPDDSDDGEGIDFSLLVFWIPVVGAIIGWFVPTHLTMCTDIYNDCPFSTKEHLLSSAIGSITLSLIILVVIVLIALIVETVRWVYRKLK